MHYLEKRGEVTSCPPRHLISSNSLSALRCAVSKDRNLKQKGFYLVISSTLHILVTYILRVLSSTLEPFAVITALKMLLTIQLSCIRYTYILICECMQCASCTSVISPDEAGNAENCHNSNTRRYSNHNMNHKSDVLFENMRDVTLYKS